MIAKHLRRLSVASGMVAVLLHALSPAIVASADERLIFAIRLHLTSTDAFYKAGTVFEALDSAGKAVIGAGFPDIFNTVEHHNDSQLHVFVRDGNHEVEVTDLGKPSGWMTSGLLVVGGRLTAVNRSKGWERAIHDPKAAKWRYLDKAGFASVRASALGVDLGQADTDCGWVISVRAGLGLLGNCILAAGRHLSLLGGVANIKIGPNERLRPFYVAHGWILMRRISEISAERGLVACRYKDALVLDVNHPEFLGGRFNACVFHPHQSVSEFAYAVALDGDRLIVSTNHGNVIAIAESVGEAPVITVLRDSDGTSFQLYTSVQFRNELIWGQYPDAALIRFVKRDEVSSTLPAIPIDHYRESAKPELQSFAIYKGELMAGVWPFGEVYRLAPESSEWTLLNRFFPGGPVAADSVEPFSKIFNDNRYGQRITDMVAFGDSVYVATGSKTGLEANADLPAELAAVVPEYGKVHRVRSTGALAVPLDRLPADSSIVFEVRVYGDRLEVVNEAGHVTATARVAGDVRCSARIRTGEGTFGRLRGAVTRVEIATVSRSCP